MSQYRQGDLLFESVEDIPADSKPSESKILAYGEVTGHSHQLLIGDFKRFDLNDEVYLDLPVAGEVVHEEHATIPLEPGKFRVTRQRQFDPLLSIPKPVID